ncbi:MAG TPA: cupin domain-containing protein [Candidatus Anoxymicrobiaceae bacterium]|jgi:mannose-6-phosphate isomerase-like protein (cupin superfamily)
MIEVHSYEKKEVEDTPHDVDIRKLLETEHALVLEIKLLHGQGQKKHIAPVDVFFYVLEGSGTVEINDEQVYISEDQLVQCPAGSPHRLFSEGGEPFRFLVVKTPGPTESSRIL